MPSCPLLADLAKSFWILKPPATACARKTGSENNDVVPAELQVALKASIEAAGGRGPSIFVPEKVK